MKNLCLVVLSWILLCLQSATAHTSIMFKHQSLVNFEKQEYGKMVFNAPIVNQFSPDAKDYRTSRRYKNAKSMQRSGIVLTAVGGSCFALSGALLGFGINGIIKNGGVSATGFSGLGYSVATTCGIIVGVAAITTTIPGIVCLVRSGKRMRAAKKDF